MPNRFLTILVVALLQNASFCEPILQPPALQPGDQYRLAFITSTGRDATSTSIADYDAFVQMHADAEPTVASWGLEWQVIGSTASIDARDHTRTNPEIDGVGVPIYLVDGTLLSPNNEGLWGSPVDNNRREGFRVIEDGRSAQFIPPDQLLVYTGTDRNGQGTRNRQLGLSRVTAGDAFSAEPSFWWSETTTSGRSQSAFYAISRDVLTAVPEPSTSAWIGILALASLTFRKPGR